MVPLKAFLIYSCRMFLYCPFEFKNRAFSMCIGLCFIEISPPISETTCCGPGPLHLYPGHLVQDLAHSRGLTYG